MFNVLIIDDDHTDSLMLERVLIKKFTGKIDIQIFDDPELALEELQKNGKVFHLVICDYYMPKVNGLDLIKEIRKIKQELEIILLSGAVGQDINVEQYIDDALKIRETIPGPPILFLGKPTSPIIFTEYVYSLLSNFCIKEVNKQHNLPELRDSI